MSGPTLLGSRQRNYITTSQQRHQWPTAMASLLGDHGPPIVAFQGQPRRLDGSVPQVEPQARPQVYVGAGGQAPPMEFTSDVYDEFGSQLPSGFWDDIVPRPGHAGQLAIEASPEQVRVADPARDDCLLPDAATASLNSGSSGSAGPNGSADPNEFVITPGFAVRHMEVFLEVSTYWQGVIDSHPYNGKVKHLLEAFVSECVDTILHLNNCPVDSIVSVVLEAIANKFAHVKMTVKPFLPSKSKRSDATVDLVEDASDDSDFDVSKLFTEKVKQRPSWKSGSLNTTSTNTKDTTSSSSSSRDEFSSTSPKKPKGAGKKDNSDKTRKDATEQPKEPKKRVREKTCDGSKAADDGAKRPRDKKTADDKEANLLANTIKKLKKSAAKDAKESEATPHGQGQGLGRGQGRKTSATSSRRRCTGPPRPGQRH